MDNQRVPSSGHIPKYAGTGRWLTKTGHGLARAARASGWVCNGLIYNHKGMGASLDITNPPVFGGYRTLQAQVYLAQVSPKNQKRKIETQKGVNL